MLFLGIYYQKQLAKGLVRKKLYLIALTDLRSKILAMLDIKIMANLGGVTY